MTVLLVHCKLWFQSSAWSCMQSIKGLFCAKTTCRTPSYNDLLNSGLYNFLSFFFFFLFFLPPLLPQNKPIPKHFEMHIWWETLAASSCLWQFDMTMCQPWIACSASRHHIPVLSIEQYLLSLKFNLKISWSNEVGGGSGLQGNCLLLGGWGGGRMLCLFKLYVFITVVSFLKISVC